MSSRELFKGPHVTPESVRQWFLSMEYKYVFVANVLRTKTDANAIASLMR